MSQRPINLSPDLRRLRDEGYSVEVGDGHLFVKDICYVTDTRAIQRGTLCCPVSLAGDIAQKPADHTIMFSGSYPCSKEGQRIAQIQHQEHAHVTIAGISFPFSFSNKPPDGYQDYYEKITQYIKILSSPAHAIDPTIKNKLHRPVPSDHDDNFAYQDTATSRAAISSVRDKIKNQRIAIIGLGGTGSYVLDFVSKVDLKEIHLFDKDEFLQHNAFRSPGAATLEELQRATSKVAYLSAKYSNIHRRIIPHEENIHEGNVGVLSNLDFVFVCIDDAAAKRAITNFFKENSTPYVDVGLGIILDGDTASLSGMVRTTTSTSSSRNLAEKHIPLEDGGPNEYARNIQIVELNALNASIAVIQWKKLFGFYLDKAPVVQSVYALSTNSIINERSP